MMKTGYLAAFGFVDTVSQTNGLNDNPPHLLHHYTSMDVGRLVLTNQDLRLSHCEYLNDSKELRQAIDTIRRSLETLMQNAHTNRREHDFYDNVLQAFDARSYTYEAFVFCMSAGDGTKTTGFPQDMLSCWRGYGRDGRGICLSFDSNALKGFNNQQKIECRLSKIIYSAQLQEKVVREIIDEGWKYLNRSQNQNDAIEATVVALMFMMPTMKHHTFEEEREWRFIYVPEPNDPTASKRGFHPGPGGLLIPYYSLNDILSLTTPQALPIQEIMVGPSPYQELNIRSLEFLRKHAVIRSSQIPYRSAN